MRNVIVCAVLVGMGFHSYLQNFKLKLERDRYRELYELATNINDQKAELFNEMRTKYLAQTKKSKSLREQNYILTRKFRKTDTKKYRQYLSKLIRETSGIGGISD